MEGPKPTPVVERAGHDQPDSTLDTTRRDALARSLCARISDARRTTDELRVIDVILTRISGGGFDEYGGMVLATDRRDFRKEAADEFADALWYMAADVVRRTDERLDRIRCEDADEHARTNPVEKGLEELCDAEPIVPRTRAIDFDDRFDDSDSDAPRSR